MTAMFSDKASYLSLIADFELIDELIRSMISRCRQEQSDEKGYKGLFISEQEIDGLQNRLLSSDQNQEQRSQNTTETIKSPSSDKLRQLQNCFELTEFDINLLLICLAPELDLRYERCFAYLQDDITKKRATVDLALQLLCQNLGRRLGSRSFFGNDNNLFKYRLLSLVQDPSQPETSLLNRFLKIDDQIVNYILGIDIHDHKLSPYATFIESETNLAQLVLSDNFKARVNNLLTVSSPVVYLQGTHGSGRRTLAEAVCESRRINLLTVDCSKIVNDPQVDFYQTILLGFREAIIRNSSLHLNNFDPLLKESNTTKKEFLYRLLPDLKLPTFISGHSEWEYDYSSRNRPFFCLKIPLPGYENRVVLWKSILKKEFKQQNSIDCKALANKFRFNGGQIHDAVKQAQQLATIRQSDCQSLFMNDLHDACRNQSSHNLSKMARKIKPTYGWKDIVLPTDQLNQLREICERITYAGLVYDKWGFEKKRALGRGISALFFGPSGTGKTMAASIMANELDLDLYKIDLSSVVSKYIGETEKNLSKIFNEAESSHSILFFDEADALFGKRSEVRDAHDRYANIEISYLLQRMEEYKGIVILATNLSNNMDSAFVRRLHFSIEFPFPDRDRRLQIWELIWPENMPRNANLDLKFMAENVKVSGGNIQNIALGAAFSAAKNKEAVSMEHLIYSTRREYQKIGKMVVEDEFEGYAN